MNPARKFLIGAVLAFAAMQLAVVWYLTHDCSSAFYRFGYMAYCDGNFAYYEHGALYYDVEAGAVANLKRADVLFLGDSYSQVAFSAPDVDDFFRRLNVRYYLMGFSYNETHPLADALIEKYHLHPKLVVINADNFFHDQPSIAGQEVLSNRQRDEYIYKKFAQTMHELICGSRFGSWICTPRMTVFRSSETGAWRTDKWISGDVPILPSDHMPTAQELDRYTSRARAFLDLIHLPPRCVVFTVVPSNGDPRSLGEHIASALGSPFIAPDAAGLLTIDGKHLNPASAERWSKAFISELAPLLPACGVTQ